jgi:hypothetical protein
MHDDDLFVSFFIINKARLIREGITSYWMGIHSVVQPNE